MNKDIIKARNALAESLFGTLGEPSILPVLCGEGSIEDYIEKGKESWENCLDAANKTYGVGYSINGQSHCVSWSKECNLEQTESYEYCLKKHCEINNEGCPSCEDCLQYDDME